MTARSRLGSICARWLRLSALALAASSLAVACFLNPKTDDLPGTNLSLPDVPGGEQEEPGAGGIANPDDFTPGNGPPPHLGAGDPQSPDPAPDAGSPIGDTLATDAGVLLLEPLTHDAGSDAD